ncbi:ubiquinone/menaquinone biosynthesis C-methylase UbiE [Nitrobacteraceae bacterium AZCC 1564]
MNTAITKDDVRQFWEAASCGEDAFAIGEDDLSRLKAQAAARYALEPYIFDFARFPEANGKSVLEIGVGMGADHEQWALNAPARLCGIDLTERAIEFTSQRLSLSGLNSELQTADAEHLPFQDQSFDIVYSWGVLHHSPDTQCAFKEVSRVLKPGGVARIMVYHKHSITGFLLWARYGVKSGLSLAEVYALYLESPGTKAYSLNEAKDLCETAGLDHVKIKVQLCSGDLLEGAAGQRHQGRLLNFAKAVWPRPLIKAVGARLGLFMMIEASK